MSACHAVTQVLREWTRVNQQALEELTPLVYPELRQLTAAYLPDERPDHTPQPPRWYTRLTCGWSISSTRVGIAGRTSSGRRHT